MIFLGFLSDFKEKFTFELHLKLTFYYYFLKNLSRTNDFPFI